MYWFQCRASLILYQPLDDFWFVATVFRSKPVTKFLVFVLLILKPRSINTSLRSNHCSRIKHNILVPDVFCKNYLHRENQLEPSAAWWSPIDEVSNLLVSDTLDSALAICCELICIHGLLLGCVVSWLIKKYIYIYIYIGLYLELIHACGW